MAGGEESRILCVSDFDAPVRMRMSGRFAADFCLWALLVGRVSGVFFLCGNRDPERLARGSADFPALCAFWPGMAGISAGRHRDTGAFDRKLL